MTSFFIDQHGCAKNQVDGELIINRLNNLGLTQVFDADGADVIIVNSCGFIESAKKESIDALLFARKRYPDAKILLTGCLAERYADILKDSMPEADGIFGNGDLSKIDGVVQTMLAGERPVLVPPQKGVCCGERRTLLSFRGSAFVKITEGCSNHCSFCAIPLIRGELRSRKASAIVSEIKELVRDGIREINLIGQDLAAYGTGDGDDVFGTGTFPLPAIDENGVNCGTKTESALSLLLKNISALDGNFILRLLYIHPDHFNRDVLAAIKADRRILRYFDIPFQSGCTKVIRSMNRRGSFAEYARLVRDIRAALPDAVIRTTFLTGFPGETDEDALETQRFLREIQSAWSGCFPYSREEDTPAYGMKKRVAAKTAKFRADALTAIQADITARHLAARVGEAYDVLIEEIIVSSNEGDGCGDADGDAGGLAIGRAWFQAPDVDGSVVVRYDCNDASQKTVVQAGRFVRVKIEAAGSVDLNGVFIDDSPLNEDAVQSRLIFAPEVQNADDTGLS